MKPNPNTPATPDEVLRAIQAGSLDDGLYPSAAEIIRALDANGWHAGQAARTLRIGRATLWRRLTALGISLRFEKKKRWPAFWWSRIWDRYERKRDRKRRHQP